MAYGIEQYKDKLWSSTWTSRLSTFMSGKRYKEPRINYRNTERQTPNIVIFLV